MKKTITAVFLLLISMNNLFAQTGISSDGSAPHSSAMLEVKSTSKGLLPPRMSTPQRTGIPSPASGLMIFNTDCNDMQFFNGSVWVPVGNIGSLATPAAIAGNASPCINASGVGYSVIPVPGATAYHWTVPPGVVIVSGQGTSAITVNFTTSNGMICVAAANDCYRSEFQCLPITLSAMITAGVSISASANTVCAGTQVTFTATPVNGGSAPQYQWKKNGNPVSGATNATYSYAPANNDAVTCVMTSNAACVTGNPATSNSVLMTVIGGQPVSVTNVASANPVCAGTQVTFTATPVNGGTAPQYQWKKNSANISGATNSTYTYAPANGDAVYCVLTSNATCPSGNPANSNTVTMAVNATTPVSVSIAASANPVCAGSSVTFTASPVNGGAAPQYQWKKNNVNISGATNSVYSYAPANSDALTCVVTSNIACPSGNPATSNAITMTVNTLVTASVSISANANTVCAGTQVTFTATPVNGGSTPQYQWKKNGNTISGATNATYSYAPANNDAVTCVMTSNAACVTGSPATSNSVSMTVIAGQPVSVTIAASANPVCAGTQVTFTATPVNGGTAPQYQWKKNTVNVSGATNATYTYPPANGDAVACLLTSNLLCATGSPATSNPVNMSVTSAPDAPTAGSHTAGQTQITWNWNPVAGATGYKWNTVNNYATATDMGTATTKTETGLTCNTTYTRYAWAYNGCGNLAPATLVFTTLGCPGFTCGQILAISHTTAGGVAPVNKTTAYGTITGIPGETAKCWITSNLGSDHQATAVSDATEASAGWYWQFNRKQGYRHDGSTLTPSWTLSLIEENSDWQTAADPCNLELGLPWRIPTYTEWYNVDYTGTWTNWNGPWNSGLKLHAAGYLSNTAGTLSDRGTAGYLWSKTQSGNSNGWSMYYYTGNSYPSNFGYKAFGFSLRCIRE